MVVLGWWSWAARSQAAGLLRPAFGTSLEVPHGSAGGKGCLVAQVPGLLAALSWLAPWPLQPMDPFHMSTVLSEARYGSVPVCETMHDFAHFTPMQKKEKKGEREHGTALLCGGRSPLGLTAAIAPTFLGCVVFPCLDSGVHGTAGTKPPGGRWPRCACVMVHSCS